MSVNSLTKIANKHNFTNTFTAEYNLDKTALTLITPTSGKKIKVTGVYISTEGATTIGQKIRVYFVTSANTVASFFPSAVANTASTIELSNIVVEGAVDEVLSLTSDLGNDKNYYIAVNYEEV